MLRGFSRICGPNKTAACRINDPREDDPRLFWVRRRKNGSKITMVKRYTSQENRAPAKSFKGTKQSKSVVPFWFCWWFITPVVGHECP